MKNAAETSFAPDADTKNVNPNSAPVDGAAEQARVVPAPEMVAAIIRKRVYASVALGFLPLPLVDLAGLTAIQIEMLHALCAAHKIPFKTQWVKSSISALLGSGVTVAAVPALFSLLKAIPVVGFTVSAATCSLSGAASTYAMGLVFDRHFRNGGSLNDFEAGKYKAYFEEKLTEGKEYAKKLRGKKETEPAAQPAAATTETA